MSQKSVGMLPVSNNTDGYAVDVVCRKDACVSFTYSLPSDPSKCFRFCRTNQENVRLKCSYCWELYKRNGAGNAYPKTYKYNGVGIDSDPEEGHLDGCQPYNYAALFTKFCRISADSLIPDERNKYPLDRVVRMNMFSVISRSEHDPSKCFRFTVGKTFMIGSIVRCAGCRNCESEQHLKLNSKGSKSNQGMCKIVCCNGRLTVNPKMNHKIGCEPFVYSEVMGEFDAVSNKNIACLFNRSDASIREGDQISNPSFDDLVEDLDDNRYSELHDTLSECTLTTTTSSDSLLLSTSKIGTDPMLSAMATKNRLDQYDDGYDTKTPQPNNDPLTVLGMENGTSLFESDPIRNDAYIPRECSSFDSLSADAPFYNYEDVHDETSSQIFDKSGIFPCIRGILEFPLLSVRVPPYKFEVLPVGESIENKPDIASSQVNRRKCSGNNASSLNNNTLGGNNDNISDSVAGSKRTSCSFIYKCPLDPAKCFRFTLNRRAPLSCTLLCSSCITCYHVAKKAKIQTRYPLLRQCDGYAFDVDPLSDHLPGCKPLITQNILANCDILKSSSEYPRKFHKYPLIQVTYHRHGKKHVSDLSRVGVEQIDNMISRRKRSCKDPPPASSPCPPKRRSSRSCVVLAKEELSRVEAGGSKSIKKTPSCISGRKSYKAVSGSADLSSGDDNIPTNAVLSRLNTRSRTETQTDCLIVAGSVQCNGHSHTGQNDVVQIRTPAECIRVKQEPISATLNAGQFNNDVLLDNEQSTDAMYESDASISLEPITAAGVFDVLTAGRQINVTIPQEYTTTVDTFIFTPDDIASLVIDKQTIKIDFIRKSVVLGVPSAHLSYALELPSSVDPSTVNPIWDGTQLVFKATRY